jgi:glycosyltransferase involved in cell wall biosynthesis
MLLGWREPETMVQYYAGIDVGLYCLTVQNEFCKSKSPTKLFEYMACGKPSVSTNYGEAPRFIEHGVTGFLASDFDEFARCCAVLLNDRDLRLTMGRNARKQIESQYNIARGARMLQEILIDRSE